MANKLRFAFRDIRTTVELLASGRPPKSIEIRRSNPVSKKLTSLTSLAKKKIGGGLFGKLKKFAVKYAAKAALGPAGYAAFKVIDGKFNISGKIGGAISAKFGKNPLSSLSKTASRASIGAKIIEETNPEKIRRPIREGLSASASAAARSLSETHAANIRASLISGIPMGSALPAIPRQFKTAASLVASHRFWNPTKATFELDANEVKLANNAVQYIPASTPDAVLYPQRGLLEDEIIYRLTLLAENVYAPTQAHAVSAGYGGLRILEGFRAEHTGTSPHETGEAIDITLGSGSLTFSRQCYELAQWMRDNILYDQLILCFSPIEGGQVWIHVSFTPDSRRRQVLTKPFNDLHVDGLHLYGGYSSATAQNADVAYMSEVNDSADALMDTLVERQERSEPVALDTVNPVQSPANLITTGTVTGADGVECTSACVVAAPPGVVWVSSAEVQNMANQVKSELMALGLTFKSADELSPDTDFDAYHRELEKYMCIAVPTLRRLYEQYPSVGLEIYSGPSGTEYNAESNRYYSQYGSQVAKGETPLPAGLKCAFDTILLSKYGPSADFISAGGGIYFGIDGCAGNIGDWQENWRNPWDGTQTNYPTAPEYNTISYSPAGCNGK